MGIVGIGNSAARICILIGELPTVSAIMDRTPFSQWGQSFIEQKLNRAGLHIADCYVLSFRTTKSPTTDQERQDTIARLNTLPNLQIIIPLGSEALQLITGHTSIDKWNLSPLDTLPTITCKRCIPTFSPNRVNSEVGLSLYVEKAFIRVREGLTYNSNSKWKRKPYNFLINPNYEDTLDILQMIEKTQTVVANDIETGGGIINTVGFAWSEVDAIAIDTLPERLSDHNYHTLWTAIARILESTKIRKVYQNNIYETIFYSAYGIKVQNTYFDTMWAQKFMWPEFDQGLDNVGRFYTNEPYWKDIGKDYKGEGGKKDWVNVRDWVAHRTYNCFDTTGTFEAMINQTKDLESRGQSKFFHEYIMKLAEPIAEMCSHGLPVDETVRHKLEVDVSAQIATELAKLTKQINVKSWKQKQELLLSKGYSIPTVRKKGESKSSTNELALKKLRIKYPEDTDITVLLRVAKLNKALSSYIRVPYSDDGILRYTMNGTGTETLRFASHKDPWERGLNPQTIPSEYKRIFRPPDNHIFFQVDLSQAESRFVAYDSCDTDLIRMLEDPTQDIHSYVAAHIFGVSVEQVQEERKRGDISKRQLGKKSGHGANYDMGWATFQDSCLKEMDLVLDRKMSEKVLNTYHTLFPGIRRGHARIRDELYRTRTLSNPFGFTRHFYGRLDDNTFREAYAFKPQSTIPMITNHLMLGLLGQRDIGALDFNLHLQVHDSLVLSCINSPSVYGPIAEYCYNLDLWHPEIILPAGRLRIPTECEIGPTLKDLKGFKL